MRAAVNGKQSVGKVLNLIIIIVVAAMSFVAI